MNVLIVSNSLPYPPHDGSRLTLFNLLRILSSRHNIDLVAFLDHPDLAIHEDKIKHYCENLYSVLAKQQHSKLDKVFYNLSWHPYIVVKKYSMRMDELIKDRIVKKHYDIIHFDGFGMLPYGLSIRRIPRIAFVLDAVSLYFHRNLIYEKHLSKKISSLTEFIKMKMYEKRIYNRFERCVVVSKIDKIALQQHCSGAKISVMPVGVDTEYFNSTSQREDFPSLLFSGNMDFPPNVHAILWFVKKVWPVVRKSCPNLKLYIAGRNPSPALHHLRMDKQIIITGFVEDIRPYFDRATIYVCPMVSGAGMKDKLLEAMAMRKAIVASPLSIQGIPNAADENCFIIAKDHNEFTEQIIKLLGSPDQRQRFESNARRFVKENYSWKNSAKILEQVYERAISEFTTNRGKKHLSY